MAAMKYDLRWLLWIEWPLFGWCLWWLAAHTKERLLVTILGVILLGVGVYELSSWLKASDVAGPPPPQRTARNNSTKGETGDRSHGHESSRRTLSGSESARPPTAIRAACSRSAHTGPDVTEGLVITQANAETLLAHDAETAENFVRRVVKVALTQAQFDALVDFAFNCGTGNLLRSTLLQEVNAGRFDQAVTEFGKWDRVAGQEN